MTTLLIAPTFRSWLGSQAHRSDPIGDLAVCVVTDTAFPDEHDEMVQYIADGHVDASTEFALADAWADYQARFGAE